MLAVLTDLARMLGQAFEVESINGVSERAGDRPFVNIGNLRITPFIPSITGELLAQAGTEVDKPIRFSDGETAAFAHLLNAATAATLDWR